MPPELRATYRVQLTPEFGFDDAGALASYLAELGVSHLYTSPYLQAASGSTHGYDVVDHTRLNAELGGERWHRQMCDSLNDHGLGHVLDIVPNHMAITADNRWWWDVLENGPSSRFASFFDVDWDPPEAKLRNTVLLPVLADHYGRVLEAGRIALVREGGGFLVRYEDHELPVAPPTMEAFLGPAASASHSDELESIAIALSRLPPSTATDRESVRERHRDKEVLRARLAQLLEQDAAVAHAVDAALAVLNADVDALDALLARQNYRLAYWRTAADDLDYRRFFSISSLAAVRVEEDQVFDEVHALVIGLVNDGVVDGLRVDHVDGLRDPKGYLERLARATRGCWTVVEKILERGESLPSTWPVAGTTGYDFANLVLGLLVDPTAERPLTELYHDIAGEQPPWPVVARAARLQVMDGELAADVRRVTQVLVEACEESRRARDYTRREVREVVREVAAAFPVYRTYADAEAAQVSEADASAVAEAIASARADCPHLDAGLLDFVADVLLLRERTLAAQEFAMRFPQLTSPVMAKGVEDTAFYTYNRFIALNEVGGDPGRFGVGIQEFHEANVETQRWWPAGLRTTATHDTKRGEDVRARLAVLSELPDAWAAAARDWADATRRHARDGAPDANLVYLLLQTLVGAWPLTRERAAAFATKAAREAKVHTSWSAPDDTYESALAGFLDGVFADHRFLEEVAGFVNDILTAGRVNSLAQTLLKLTSPGVPDVYQGTELWDDSLVDPDNRRPVDYDRRRLLLGELAGVSAEAAWARAYEGLPKLLVVRNALRLRARCPGAFGADAEYVPIWATGRWSDRVVAFSRGDDVVTVVPRLSVAVGRTWDTTAVELPPGRWRNQLTGGELDGGRTPVSELLSAFPVALLARP